LDDDFWQFHLPEFLRLVPAPGRPTVDVGCGEGRLGRVLTDDVENRPAAGIFL
jgi:hypothetical protein